MDTHVASDPLHGVAQLVRRPVQEVVEWLRRVQESTGRLAFQMREVATLVLRALDGVALQATRLRAKSEVELVFGALTVTVTSGAAYVRPGARIADLVSTDI